MRSQADGPPEEPPVHVTSELLWRLSVRLFHDHSVGSGRPGGAAEPGALGVAGEPVAVCAGCGRRWPCSGRRMAELGLNAASTTAVRLQSLMWLSDYRQPSPAGNQP
jgi:hypothetical protein